jgi:hypothetical protein
MVFCHRRICCSDPLLPPNLLFGPPFTAESVVVRLRFRRTCRRFCSTNRLSVTPYRERFNSVSLSSLDDVFFLGETLPRRPATTTQADIARVIRAAKQEGAPAVEVCVGGEVRIVIPLLDKQCADSLRTFLADRMRTLPAPENPLADSTEIVL